MAAEVLQDGSDKTLNGKDLVAYKWNCIQEGPIEEGPSWAHDTTIRNTDSKFCV